MKFRNLVSASIALSISSSINAYAAPVELIPVSYSFDQATDTGSFTYHDETGIQLIDGHYGTAPWSANLGNGNAYEWLGWVYDSPVNIDFDLGSQNQVNQISIGSVQDHVNDVVLPSIELYSSNDGVNWSLFDSMSNPESSLNDNQYFTLEFDNLQVTAQYFRVSLLHSLNGPWTFVDEVDFYHEVSAVPVPAAVWLFGSGLVGLISFSRRKQSQA